MKESPNAAILHNGVQMPWVGLGVFKVPNEVTKDVVKQALERGYRSIDTAAMYGNEEGVGQAIAESGIPRDEIFVTTKLWNTDHGYEEALTAFEKSVRRLGLDYIDLYLIHWPVPSQRKYKETWKALEKLYQEGRVRAIGTSNFQVHHLEDLLADCQIKPMVNQVECHPRLNQNELRQFCQNNHIQLEAWSPLMKGELLNDPVFVQLAEKYGKTPAQIILRWDYQNGVVTIPKSVHPERMKENAGIFDFELIPEDMDRINNLNRNERVGPDPDQM
jgi:diketogulonate reductase-like aldo/keto reductase